LRRFCRADILWRTGSVVLNGAFFPPEKPPWKPCPKHRPANRSHLPRNIAPIEETARSAAGVWGVTKGGLACEAALSESPVSIQKGFQDPVPGEASRSTLALSSSGECPRRVSIRRDRTAGVWLSIQKDSKPRWWMNQVAGPRTRERKISFSGQWLVAG